MNVLLINATDDNGGGASRVAMDIFNGIKERGEKTTMFVGNKTSNNPEIHKINKPKWRSIASHLLANDSKFFNTDKIIKTPEFTNADIVHAHNLHGWYFNLETLQLISEQKPIVWTLHDMWAITPHCAYAFDTECQNGFFPCPSRQIYPSILWPNEKYLMKQKRNYYLNTKMHLVTPSQWLADKVSQSILNDKALTIIPNGIDTDIFAPQDQKEARKKLNLPINKKIVLFIAHGGLKNEFKGGIYVKEMAKRYMNNSEIIFVCVGGDKECQYENIFERQSINNKTTLREYYSSADVLLFPSTAENFPLVILEAMACGLQIVAFDVGGVKEAIVSKEYGYLAMQKNIDDLYHGIDLLLTRSEAERSSSRLHCRNRAVTEYSLTTMVERYINLYTSLL